MKKIAVLTSGGDAPGMNAAIRAVVRTAVSNKIEVIGFLRGYQGLIDNDFVHLSVRDVGNIIQSGGTMLKTSRCHDFMTTPGFKKAMNNLAKNKVDGLVVIGGDGSYKGADAISKAGVKAIAIPGTIDNDLHYTDFTLGFDTAVDTIVSLMNNIRDTANSHERLSVVEVMGATCGDIALYSGIACGAEIIIVPEVKMSVNQICEKLVKSQKERKRSSIIMLAEGAGKASELLKKIKGNTGIEGRELVVGHLQRGGSPSTIDRVYGTRFGNQAVNLLMEGKGGLALGVRCNKLISVPIIDALNTEKVFNMDLYKLNDIISI